MSPDARERGPRQETPPVLPAAKILAPIDGDLDELAQHVNGTFVLVVQATAGQYRRRCFLTAAAAEKACRRAQARGENAEVILAELKPLWRLLGGSS